MFFLGTLRDSNHSNIEKTNEELDERMALLQSSETLLNKQLTKKEKIQIMKKQVLIVENPGSTGKKDFSIQQTQLAWNPVMSQRRINEHVATDHSKADESSLSQRKFRMVKRGANYSSSLNK